MNMRYSALVERIRGDGADAWLTHYEATAARERGEDAIVLSIGDPPIDTPTAIVERAIERLRAGDTHYTPACGRPALRSAIASAHATRTGHPTGAENVIVLAGTQNALFVTSLCIAGPGDEVISFDPMYPTYAATLEVCGAKMVRAPQPASGGFRPDIARLAELVTTRTRAIVFASPNNPTGVVLTDAELAALGELARSHNLWLIADEVYAVLAPDGRPGRFAAALAGQVVSLGSLSKSHAMTGWRCGWLIGPRELVQHAEAVAMCMLFGLPGFVQDAALTALENSEQVGRDIRKFCRRRRDFFLHALEGLPGITPYLPEAGMFMLLDVRDTGLDGRAFARALYASQRVSVMDGGGFGYETQGFVRVCFATDEATLIEAIRRMRVFLEGEALREAAAAQDLLATRKLSA